MKKLDWLCSFCCQIPKPNRVQCRNETWVSISVIFEVQKCIQTCPHVNCPPITVRGWSLLSRLVHAHVSQTCVPTVQQLKYGSKCVTLIARLWNIFANLHLMHVILIVMDSKHYVGNFSDSFSLQKTAKYRNEKKAVKNVDEFFEKTIFDWCKLV